MELQIAGLTLQQLSAVGLIPTFSPSSATSIVRSIASLHIQATHSYRKLLDPSATSRPKIHQTQKEHREMAAFTLVPTDAAIKSSPVFTAVNLDTHQHSLKAILLHEISASPPPPQVQTY